MKHKPFTPGERNHWILYAAVGFLAGCLLQGFFPFSLWVWGLLAAGIGLGVLLYLLGINPGAALLVVFFALGLLRTYPVYRQSLPAEGKYTVQGYVCGEEKDKGDGKRTFVLCDICLDGTPVRGKAYCTLNEEYSEEKSPTLFDGARVSFQGKVYWPEEKSGYPHFDFRRWMYENGTPFGISIYDAIVLENTEATAPVKDITARIRTAAGAELTPLLGENTGMAMALLFGDRSSLSEEQYQQFRTLDIAHLMSVSGLHIGILAGLLAALLKALHVKRTVRLPIVMVFLFAYSGICGFSPSSLRAAIMFSMMTLAGLFSRAVDRLSALAFSALVILLINPLDGASAGFILSFSVMLGIYGFTPLISEGLDRLWPAPLGGGIPRRLYGKGRRGLCSALSLSLGAQLGALLPTICFFHQLPVYGLFINTLLVPFVGLLLTPLLLVCTLLAGIPMLNTLLGGVAGLGCNALLSATELLCRLPGAVIRVGTPSGFLIAGSAAAALLLTRLVPGKLRYKALMGAGVLVVALGLSFASRPASLRYIQLSVGQADSALLLDGDRTLAIDTGDDGQELLDYLLWENRNIDELYLTHLHSDHMGGVITLLENRISIGKVYVPSGWQATEAASGAASLMERLEAESIPVEELSTGDVKTYSHCSLRLLWPDEGKVRGGTAANEASMVLYIALGRYTLLQMGDLGENYEHYAVLPANVLKLAHHGSAYASQRDFLETVHPDAALISCSGSSSYLPSSKTLGRLGEQNIPYLRSDESGDVTLIPTENALLIQPYRSEALP